MPAARGIVYQLIKASMSVCICCSLALRDQSHAAEEGRKVLVQSFSSCTFPRALQPQVVQRAVSRHGFSAFVVG